MERLARHPVVLFALMAPLYFLPSAIGRGPVAEPAKVPEQQAQIELTAPTNLVAKPRKGAAVIEAMSKGARLVLITTDQRDGYYRVIREGHGPVGWIDGAAAKVVSERREATSHHACAASLDACPLNGCAAENAPEAILNSLKRRIPNPQIPLPLVQDDFRTLQRIADESVGQNYPGMDRNQRAKLQGLKVAGGRAVSEGRVVRAFGYIAKNGEGLHVNGGESANCNLKSADDNDIHIPLVEAAGDSEFKSIAVKMIPQQRRKTWTLEALKDVQEHGYQVWVEGPLLYDTTHYVSDDADNPLPNDANRVSLWEIHPVTRFLVCRKKRCERENESDWQLL